MVEFLLKNGSNPNVMQYNERTPLHEAARFGEQYIRTDCNSIFLLINLMTVNFFFKTGELKAGIALIKHGANPNIGGERTGWRPLQEAVKYGNHSTCSLTSSFNYDV